MTGTAPRAAARRRALRLSAAAIAVAVAAAPGVGASLPPPSAPSDGSDEARLVFVGDTGTGDHRARGVAERIRRTAEEEGVSHVFLLGDSVHEEGRDTDIERKFLSVFRPVLDIGIRIHAALGNHDVEKCRDSGARPAPRTSRVYRRAGDCWADAHLGTAEFGYESGFRYYSVRVPSAEPPMVEVFVLDSNTLHQEQGKIPDGADAPQVAWLTEALRDSTARWKIVAMHHPIYSPRRCLWWIVRCRGANVRLRAQLEPLFREHGVDLVFQGHMHLYARLRPRHGIQYFVTGAGSKRPDGFLPDEATHPREGRGRFNHFVYLRLTEDGFEYSAIDAAGEVRDSGRRERRPEAEGRPRGAPTPR